MGERKLAYDTVKNLQGPSLGVLYELNLNEILQEEIEDVEIAYLKTCVSLDDYSRKEFARISHNTKLNHFKCLKYDAEMWSLIYGNEGSSIEMDSGIRQFERLAVGLEAAATNCEAGYLKLISKFPDSFVLLEMCAQFHHKVYNDTLFARHLHNQAKQLKALRKDGSLTSQNSLRPRVTGNVRNSSLSHFGRKEERRASNGSLFVSAANAETAKENQQIRRKMQSRNAPAIKLFTLIGLALGVYNVFCLIIWTNYTKPNFDNLNFLNLTWNRDIKSVKSFYWARSLESSALSSDWTQYAKVKDGLHADMSTLEQVAWESFKLRTLFGSDLAAYFVSDTVDFSFSAFPELNTTKIFDKTTMLEFLLNIADNGRFLSIRNPSDISWSSNNQYRFLLNNALSTDART